MSVPDTGAAPGAPRVPAGLTCASLPADIIELAALRDRTHVLRALGARRGLNFPEFGRVARAREMVVLCTRPERWLVLTAPGPPRAALSLWREACAGCAAAIDLSSAFTALHLAGSAVREVLARADDGTRTGHIFNLGHGVLPETDPGILAAVVEQVHRETALE